MDNNFDNRAEHTYYDIENARPKREFSSGESAFAWASFLIGYLFFRVFMLNQKPLGAFLLTVAVFSATTLLLIKSEKKPSALSYVIAASSMILSFSLLFSQNTALHILSSVYCSAAYIFYVYTANNNLCTSKVGDLFLFDFLRALIIFPMSSLKSIFLASFGRRSKSSKVILQLALGILLTLIPTAVILSLLSFDNFFMNTLKDIFSIDTRKLISHVFSIILGIPIGMYIFSTFVANFDSTKNTLLSSDDCRNFSKAVKVIPQVTVCTAIVPILAIYVIFFISQWNGYFSAFSGVLPEDSIYSEYARNGFFELCWVSVINLALIAVSSVFAKRKGERAPLSLRIISTIMSVFTLLLISTAMSKMFLYIKTYGLTQKRVYASLFMVLLALIFICVIIRQFVKRFNLAFAVIILCVCMLAFTAFAGIDGRIASYNIDRCLDGTLREVDITAMAELGDAAIPHLVRYCESVEDNGEQYSRVYQYLSIYEVKDADGIWSLTFTKMQAKRALDKFLPAE